jgi:hypothetical protein
MEHLLYQRCAPLLNTDSYKSLHDPGTGFKWVSRFSITLKALTPARGKSQLTPDVPGPGAPSGDGELPGPKEEAPQAVLARRRAGPLRGSTSSSARSRRARCSPRGPRTPPCTPLGVDQDHGPHVPRLEALPPGHHDFLPLRGSTRARAAGDRRDRSGLPVPDTGQTRVPR